MNQWKNLNAVLDRFVAEGTALGCGMQIFREGQMIFDRCTGDASADGRMQFTENMRLRMHSMSKNMTVAAAMTLYDQGLFALNDPIAMYLPEFSEMKVCVSDTDIHETVLADAPITIRQLLSMQSGLTYWTFPGMPHEGPVQKELQKVVQEIAEDVRNGKQNSLEEFVKHIAEMPLCFQPGAHWMYGLSLTVIGRLVEVVSGMKLSDYMQKAIWGPLGMTSTCFTEQLTGSEEIADVLVISELREPIGAADADCVYPEGRRDVFGYRKDPLPGTDLGIELPCGGMISTLHDLGKLFSMFANGGELDGKRIIGRRTLDLMRTNQLNEQQLSEFAQVTNRGFGYGLGYRTMMKPSEAGFYMPEGSFGWDGASGCYGLADPDHRLAIVFAESSVPHHIEYTIPRVVAAMNADMNM